MAITFNESGYTPNNFADLVLYSGLKSADFMKVFDIKRATFYCYKSGKFNPHWQSWLMLVIAVERYILNVSLKLAVLE